MVPTSAAALFRASLFVSSGRKREHRNSFRHTQPDPSVERVSLFSTVRENGEDKTPSHALESNQYQLDGMSLSCLHSSFFGGHQLRPSESTMCSPRCSAMWCKMCQVGGGLCEWQNGDRQGKLTTFLSHFPPSPMVVVAAFEWTTGKFAPQHWLSSHNSSPITPKVGYLHLWNF
ncbi:hypothetical protein DMENIID0001_120140 [Sergentomyia squamirostris]